MFLGDVLRLSQTCSVYTCSMLLLPLMVKFLSLYALCGWILEYPWSSADSLSFVFSNVMLELKFVVSCSIFWLVFLCVLSCCLPKLVLSAAIRSTQETDQKVRVGVLNETYRVLELPIDQLEEFMGKMFSLAHLWDF